MTANISCMHVFYAFSIRYIAMVCWNCSYS